MQQAGVPVNENFVLRGDFHAPSGYSAALKLLQQVPRPTAIFVCNDMMAIGALRAAAELGLAIPEQVAVVGFDNIELASYTSPPLSTVAQPTQEIGQLSIKLILERINNPTLPPRQNILPTRLVIRESSKRS